MLEALSKNISKLKVAALSTAIHPPMQPKPNPNDNLLDMVEHVPEIPELDDTLYAGIITELESLKLKGPSKKVLTQWLSPTSDSYNYGSVVNNPKPVDAFPNISKLKDIVNHHPSTTGDLDACLVSFFQSSNTSLKLHKDDEELISQSSSICVVSFGSPRILELVVDGKKKKNRTDLSTDLSLPATDRTMNIMKPGAQNVIKHRVKAGKPISGGPNWRYSISFRKISTLPAEEEHMEHPTMTAPVHPDLPPDKKPQEQKRYINLIAGDSFAARLDPGRLGKGKQTVYNIAKGGSKISVVQKSLENFAAEHPHLLVKKLFLSIGANDIRNCKNGIRHLKNPVGDLMKCSKILFPNAKVFLQSIPPIHPNGCQYTVGNVLYMNNLIYNLCSRYKLFYLDIFHAFLNQSGDRNDKLFPEFDSNRNSFDIHPSTRKGMPVLAKFYLRLIHSKWFNPMGY